MAQVRIQQRYDQTIYVGFKATAARSEMYRNEVSEWN